MAINTYTLDLLIKKNTNQARESLIELLKLEKKNLQNKQQYMKRVAKQEQLDSIFATESARYERYNEDIKTLNAMIRQLRAKNKDNSKVFQSYRLLNYNKRAKAEAKKPQLTAREYIKSVSDEKVMDIIRNMFYKGEFAGLGEAQLDRFNDLFNKFGFNLIDDIKAEIKKEYKNWGSDTAISSIANIVQEYQEEINSKYNAQQISEQDVLDAKELLTDFRQYIGI